MNIKNFVKIQLIRTFHNIQFEGHSKRLFFMQGMFSVHSLYFMDKLLLLIPAVSINSYYLLVSLIIVLREGFVLLWQHVYTLLFSQVQVPQYLPAGDINDEADIVNCDAGNIKRILMTNEVYNHYLKYGNERNSQNISVFQDIICMKS